MRIFVFFAKVRSSFFFRSAAPVAIAFSDDPGSRTEPNRTVRGSVRHFAGSHLFGGSVFELRIGNVNRSNCPPFVICEFNNKESLCEESLRVQY